MKKLIKSLENELGRLRKQKTPSRFMLLRKLNEILKIFIDSMIERYDEANEMDMELDLPEAPESIDEARTRDSFESPEPGDIPENEKEINRSCKEAEDANT